MNKYIVTWFKEFLLIYDMKYVRETHRLKNNDGRSFRGPSHISESVERSHALDQRLKI